MTIEQILGGIYGFWAKTKRVPKSGEEQIQCYRKEGNRKIGGWRKMLWLSGIIQEERKVRLPQFSFVLDGDGHLFDRRSAKILRRYCCLDYGRKERMTDF